MTKEATGQRGQMHPVERALSRNSQLESIPNSHPGNCPNVINSYCKVVSEVPWTSVMPKDITAEERLDERVGRRTWRD